MTRTLLMTATLLGLGLGACTVDREADLSGPQEDDTWDTGYFEAGALRVDVYPTEGASQTLSLANAGVLLDTDSRVDLVLSDPVQVTGVVTGYAVTPWAGADLPGVAGPLAGTVSFTEPQTVHSTYLRLDDETGAFDALLVPGEAYRVAVVPDDPMVPVSLSALTLTDDTTLDLDLSAGVPVWGVVRDAHGDPLTGARVHLDYGDSVVSGTVEADSEGRYLLRAEPGASLTVVCCGRDNGRDPELRSDLLTVSDEGLSWDATFANLSTVTIGGRILAPDGDPIRGATVALTAIELEGYPEGTSAQSEAITSATGTWDVRVLPGTWQIEVLPTDAWSPARIGHLAILDDEDLGDLTLTPLTRFSGVVVDPAGEPVPDTLLQVTELGFGSRTWTAVADAEGAFAVDVADTLLEITLTPSGERAEDLPLTRLDLTPERGTEVAFSTATWLKGHLYDQDAEPVSWAVVEVRELDGVLLGATFTDEQGELSVGLATR